jgi:transposase
MNTHTTIEVAFAGIDYHKKSLVIALGDRQGKLVRQPERISTDESAVRRYFSKFTRIECAVENCRGFDWLIEVLKELGHVVHISNPYGTKLIAHSRCKTDKIDSRILMELLAKGFLPTCYQPSKQEKAIKEELRWRRQLVDSSTRIKNRAIALIDKENKGHSVTFSSLGCERLQKLNLEPHRQALIQKHVDMVKDLEQRRFEEDKWLVDECKQNTAVQLLKSLPGIGDLTALTLFAELGDIKRFARSNNVTAYLGLNPRLYSSAGTRRTGSITKGGQRELRSLLIQAAWRAIKKSEPLRERFKKIAKRRGKSVAIVAIARMLAEIAFHILRTGEPYNESKLALG